MPFPLALTVPRRGAFLSNRFRVSCQMCILAPLDPSGFPYLPVSTNSGVFGSVDINRQIEPNRYFSLISSLSLFISFHHDGKYHSQFFGYPHPLHDDFILFPVLHDHVEEQGLHLAGCTRLRMHSTLASVISSDPLLFFHLDPLL
jgi:hypothetical protein